MNISKLLHNVFQGIMFLIASATFLLGLYLMLNIEFLGGLIVWAITATALWYYRFNKANYARRLAEAAASKAYYENWSTKQRDQYSDVGATAPTTIETTSPSRGQFKTARPRRRAAK